LTSAAVGRGSDYAGLSRDVRTARLLDRTPWRYGFRAALTVGGFAACWWLLARMGASWLILIPAALLGVASTQLGFLGHDGGHQQIARSRRGNALVGLVAGNLLTGLSIAWWVNKHNRHHANPNKEGYDPDIGRGVLAFTTAHAATRDSLLARAITRHQALLFFPLLTLEGFQLHVASINYLRRTPSAPLRRTEIWTLAAHFAMYLSALFLLLTPGQAFAFIAVHQAVYGLYLGCSFVTNHTGMLVIASDTKVDYLRRQVLTSRNVKGGWLIDQLLGGLNHQIEHHLFPSMPRANLRRARRLVLDCCRDQHIPYIESGLIASYGSALRYLHALGAPLRAHGVR
jgi:fatty acid desaturase